jgi:large subunit ribosomal protein L15e
VYGKPANQGINQLKNRKSLQSIAEERVGRLCQNLRVLNSYWAAEDGANKWYEVILVDPRHPRIQQDPKINWICRARHKRREARGLTSIGRKHRGLRLKGHNAKKARPSVGANWKRRQRLQLWRYR